jgi:predicted SAM-dependent methyltransferase
VTREDILIEPLDLDGIGLEIGPSYHPVIPKSSGRRIESVDHADADTLRAKYRGMAHVDTSCIEPVDYVSDGGSILDAVGQRERYDYIIASHVIEHTPDLLGFLKDCEALLKPEGILSLAVPDKRKCFDVLQPLSSTGTVLQCHYERRSRPSPAAVFDCAATMTFRNGASSWFIHNEDEMALVGSVTEAKRMFDRALTAAEYLDVHVWRFVPSSFRLIVSDLNALGELSLREVACHGSIQNEFYVFLSRSGEGCALDRLYLAKQAMREQAEIPLFR